MKRHFGFAAIVLIILFSACEDDEMIYSDPAIAGETNQSYHFQDFASGLVFDINWDSTILMGSGSIDLDLDSDGNDDLRFELYISANDSVYAYSEENPYLRILSLNASNQLGFLQFTDSVGCREANIGYGYFTDRIDAGKTIGHSGDWRIGLQYSYVWTIVGGACSGIVKGPWFYNTEPGYIGFQLDGRFGWIKLDNRDRRNPKILGVTIKP